MPAACLTCQLCLKTEPPTAEINPALIVFERCLNLQTKHLSATLLCLHIKLAPILFLWQILNKLLLETKLSPLVIPVHFFNKVYKHRNDWSSTEKKNPIHSTKDTQMKPKQQMTQSSNQLHT